MTKSEKQYTFLNIDFYVLCIFYVPLSINTSRSIRYLAAVALIWLVAHNVHKITQDEFERCIHILTSYDVEVKQILHASSTSIAIVEAHVILESVLHSRYNTNSPMCEKPRLLGGNTRSVAFSSVAIASWRITLAVLRPLIEAGARQPSRAGKRSSSNRLISMEPVNTLKKYSRI